jgi:hypothetical protein
MTYGVFDIDNGYWQAAVCANLEDAITEALELNMHTKQSYSVYKNSPGQHTIYRNKPLFTIRIEN